MRTLSNRWFLIFISAAAILIILQKTGFTTPVFTTHLTDLLAIPIICNLALAFQRKFIKQNNYRFKAGYVLFSVIYTSAVFEWLMPMLTNRYTADWIDVIMYALGGIIFWLLLNK